MLDKRCRYKVRELNNFYLFIKHRSIYYAYFPQFKVTKSTGQKDLRNAYATAWDLLATVQTGQNQQLYKPYEDKKRQRDLKRVLSYIDQSRPLTASVISKIQTKMLSEGLSGKSINNYIYVLKKAYQGDFPSFNLLEHMAVYRSCFPIPAFYHFYDKCKDRLHYLAFFAMTTGCRLGEIKTVEPVTKNGRIYLKINGTKTKNAVRTIPVLKETLDCIPHLTKGFKSASYKESVIEAGSMCGFDTAFIEENHIVFHSFRKMFKTLLESCNIPNAFIEYYMGHSQTSKVNQLYFIGSSADDSEVYPKVIEALGRYL